MSHVLLGVHFVLAFLVIVSVLMQRSEGGALGIGGGNAFLSSRGRANALSKTTMVLAVAFFLTSIGLTIFSQHSVVSRGIVQEGAGESGAKPAESVLPRLPVSPPVAAPQAPLK